MTPDLRLVYTSNPSPNDSQFGYGWNINIPSIERINRMGVDQLYATDYYNSTMDGELASTSATTYGAKFENGDFRSYTFSTSTNAWTVTDKNGVTYKFGTTAASRQDPGGSTTIYKWSS
jgi:virulence plasmid B protein